MKHYSAMETYVTQATQPKHRSDAPVDHWHSEAVCTCNNKAAHVCPRHEPDAYADMMARHATDSI